MMYSDIRTQFKNEYYNNFRVLLQTEQVKVIPKRKCLGQKSMRAGPRNIYTELQRNFFQTYRKERSGKRGI